MKMDDWQLLREYVDHGSEEAFTTLVKRHLNLTYSVALRRLGNHEAAQDVAQMVFCLLGQKARQLRSDTALVGWLYQTASFKASKYYRGESRRRFREQEAALMTPTGSEETNTVWQQLTPHLDDAINELGVEERLAILQRFFQRKPLREIGVALGIGEDAARMRVNRALEKLRSSLVRKGATCSLAVLATVLTEKSVEAAPIYVAQSIQVAALGTLKVAAAPSIIITIITIMTKAKLKTGITGLALLAMFTSSFYFYNQSKEHPQPTSIKPNISLVKTQRLAQAALRRSRKNKPLATTESANLIKKSPIENLRGILFSPLQDSMSPSRELDRAIADFGPDSHLAVTLLIEALQSNDPKAQHRAAAVLNNLAIAAQRGQWLKREANRPPSWQDADPQPLRSALLKAMPALQEKIRSCEDVNTQIAAICAANQIDPQPELLSDIVAGMTSDLKKATSIFRICQTAFIQQPDAARTVLEPLLKENDAELRFMAAYCYTALPGPKDTAVLQILIESLGKNFDDTMALNAIKTFGDAAKPFVPDLLRKRHDVFHDYKSNQCSEALLFQDHVARDKFYETLAEIDPASKNDVPELAQWLGENRVNRRDVMDAFLAVLNQTESLSADSRNTLLAAVNNHSDSYQPADIATLAEKFETFDPKLRETFIAMLLAKHPTLASVLTNKQNPAKP